MVLGSVTISIIIPVYNVENYLEECINSVLQQSARNWELVLVDDGSTDKSGRICDIFSQSNTSIKVIHKKNEGVAIARKTGCELSTGEYVMFVDSDDYLDKRCIEIVSSILEIKKYDIIKFGANCEERDGTFIRWGLKHHGLYEKEKIESDLIPYLIQNRFAEYYSPTIWGGVFLRKVIEPFLIDDRRATMGEDGACVIPAIYTCSSIYFIDEPLYYYRYNTGSLTKSKKVLNWDIPKIISTHIERCINIDDYNLKEQLYRKTVHDLFNVCVSQFNSNENYSKIRIVIINNLKNNEYYRTAIANAEFSGNKAKLMLFALKFRLVFLIYLYSKLRNC